MEQRPVWHDVPKHRVFFHSTSNIPTSTRRLYRRLSRTATGPGPIYLYKPLLHLVLPRSVHHAIVLDTDLFFFEDILGLWREFKRFAPGELIGVAVEQAPSYQEVRALGGLGYNGGVQLLALEEMRHSAHYAQLMETYARGRFGQSLPMKEKGIGWLGDQTLYSWMSVRSSPAKGIFHTLPCGWNRQIGTHMASWKGFWKSHECNMQCSLLHGNYLHHKAFMESLKRDPTGRSCKQTTDKYRSDPTFRSGTADARMLTIVKETCCR